MTGAPVAAGVAAVVAAGVAVAGLEPGAVGDTPGAVGDGEVVETGEGQRPQVAAQ